MNGIFLSFLTNTGLIRDLRSDFLDLEHGILDQLSIGTPTNSISHFEYSLDGDFSHHTLIRLSQLLILNNSCCMSPSTIPPLEFHDLLKKQSRGGPHAFGRSLELSCVQSARDLIANL